MKKIYIEGLGLVEGHFSGVGQYILGILQGLDQIIDEAKYAGKPVPEVRVIIPYNTLATFRKFGFKHIGYKRFPLSFRVMSALWYRGMLPPIDLWCGKGAYFFTRFVGMPLLFNKSATVIYDLSYEHYRQFSDERNAVFLSKHVRSTLKRTSKVIAISENAKRELIEFYNLSPSKVSVATPAADPGKFYHRSQQEIEEVKHKYNVSGDYILALSNLEPRKNLGALVETYCQLPKELTNNVALLLVGVSGWKTNKLFKDILRKVEAGYNIIRPSKYVVDADKPAIISGAKMLVYPSHYEGFGMPPLEALSCGIPVICANNSSLPEVVGQAGTLIDIDNSHELLKTMSDYLENNKKVSDRMLKAGPERAKNFSWTASARIFLELAKDLR